MEARAKHRKIAMSPRKARLVVNCVRGKNVDEALAILKYLPNKAAAYVIKVIKSCVANWCAKEGNKEEGSVLYVKKILVNEGKMLKRIQPAPQGRAHPIRKRHAHIEIIVDNRVASPTQEVTKKESDKTVKKVEKPSKKTLEVKEDSKKKTAKEKKVAPKEKLVKEGSDKEVAKQKEVKESKKATQKKAK